MHQNYPGLTYVLYYEKVGIYNEIIISLVVQVRHFQASFKTITLDRGFELSIPVSVFGVQHLAIKTNDTCVQCKTCRMDKS